MKAFVRPCGLLLAFFLAAHVPVQAAYPDHPVKVIVPFPAGTATDTVARYLFQKLQERIGQPFVIDNRAGAAGSIGAAAAARATPDGYTLFFTVNSVVTINQFIYPKLAYDPMKSFVPVSLVAAVPYVLVANKDAPYKNLQELISAAKAKPESVDYATLGVGTAPHVIMELMGSLAGIQLRHIPYKREGLTAVIGGQVPLILQPTTTVLPLIREGALVALGTTSAKRLTALPDVPAISEVVPKFAGDGWLGLQVPTGTPAAVVQRLNQEVRAVLSLPETAERFGSFGIEAWPSTPEQMRQTIEADSEKWSRVIREKQIAAQ